MQRITQDIIEVLLCNKSNKATLSQFCIEALIQRPTSAFTVISGSKAGISQDLIEVLLCSSVAKAKISQDVIEVMFQPVYDTPATGAKTTSWVTIG